MKKQEKERCKNIIFTCAQMLSKLELKMTLEEAEKLVQIRDGLSIVHTSLSEEEKKAA